MPLRGKNRSTKSITFESSYNTLTTIGNIAANETLATIAGAFPITQREKILRVSAMAALVSGSPRVQLVLGSIAPTGVGLADTLAALGVQVFAAPVTLTCSAYNCQTIAPGQMDTLYPDGKSMTIRVVTGAGDTVTGLVVGVEHVNLDAKPNQPRFAPLTPQDF